MDEEELDLWYEDKKNSIFSAYVEKLNIDKNKEHVEIEFKSNMQKLKMDYENLAKKLLVPKRAKEGFASRLINWIVRQKR